MLLHDSEALPVSDSVAPPMTHVIMQLDPPPLDEQLYPSLDSVPHRQIDCPLIVAVQHGKEDELEQPSGITSDEPNTTNRDHRPFIIRHTPPQFSTRFFPDGTKATERAPGHAPATATRKGR